MTRFIARAIARIVRLAAWFTLGWAAAWAIDRLLRVRNDDEQLAEIFRQGWEAGALEGRRSIGLDPRPRGTGLDLAEAWAAADELVVARRRGLGDAEA